MSLQEDALEFLEEERLKGLIKRYSEFINFPIYLMTTKEEEEEVPMEEGDESDEEEGEEEEEEESDEEEIADAEEEEVLHSASHHHLTNRLSTLYRAPALFLGIG